jgi:hypothetical protein
MCGRFGGGWGFVGSLDCSPLVRVVFFFYFGVFRGSAGFPIWRRVLRSWLGVPAMLTLFERITGTFYLAKYFFLNF